MEGMEPTPRPTAITTTIATTNNNNNNSNRASPTDDQVFLALLARNKSLEGTYQPPVISLFFLWLHRIHGNLKYCIAYYVKTDQITFAFTNYVHSANDVGSMTEHPLRAIVPECNLLYGHTTK